MQQSFKRKGQFILRLALLSSVFLTLALVVLQPVAANDDGQRFRFLFVDGERYRILSTVDQEVLFNEQFSHRAEILNRIAVEVADLGEGIGRLSVNYDVSEENMQPGGVFQLDRSYFTEYRQNEFGFVDVPGEYIRPMVRNVPVFPEHPLRSGDAWSNTGTEVHDLQEAFGIDGRFEFRIPVVYHYIGEDEIDGKRVDVFDVRYNMFHRFPAGLEGFHPVRISGYSDQRHYWDRELGRLHFYEEEYEINFAMSSGDTVTYRGTADARVIETNLPDRSEVLRRLQERVEELGILDTSVRDEDRGITISLENIRFPPESAELLESERRKLDRIAELLGEYPDTDLLITGHTALAGTAAGRQRLSEQRAAAVGNYLLDRDVRARDQLIIRGVGAEEPIAPNDTEAGRRRNRRVEFTIIAE